MIAVDWRDLPPDHLEPLRGLERAQWLRRFDWDLAEAQTVVEAARRGGRLAGVALIDGGRPAGCIYYVAEEDELRVGPPCAADPATRAALVRHVVRSATRFPNARRAVFFQPIFDGREAGAAGPQTIPYGYLTHHLQPLAASSAPRADGTELRPWTPDRLSATAALMRRAYASASDPRPYAPGNGWSEWLVYLSQLATTPGCGILLPGASFILQGPQAESCGVVLTTRISPRTAHIVQLAVDPACRGRGAGRTLLAAAAAGAAAAGCSQASLLVAHDNRRARAVYDRLGFSETGRFAFAWADLPRGTSAALVHEGGALHGRRQHASVRG